MKALIHKIYLVTQALILVGGTAYFVWLMYVAFYGLEAGTYDNARNCGMRAVSKDIPLGVSGSFSDRWTNLIRLHVKMKGNLEAMIAEADRITKTCSSYLAVEVSEESGDVSLFLVSKNGYNPAYDLEQVLYAFGFVLGGTALLSVLLFVIRKWIGIVFRPERSA